MGAAICGMSADGRVGRLGEAVNRRGAKDARWRITPQPAIGPRIARARWANPAYGLMYTLTFFRLHFANLLLGLARLLPQHLDDLVD